MKRWQARGRRKTGFQGSQLEDRYRDEVLTPRAMAGEIDFLHERMGFKLASRCYYYPDFVVIPSDGSPVEVHEVKGYMREDAAVKLRVFATQFPWFVVLVVRRNRQGWHYEEITP